MTFQELGLHESILEGLHYAGFEKATPIQEQAIPAVLGGRDLIACAQTGTGKTGAFLLPVMQALMTQPSDGNAVLIITPTRELALQIDMQIQGFGYFTNLHSVTVYGGGDGSDFSREKDAFKSGVPIIVATPGKLMAHMNMGYVDFSKIRYLILDEADRMLDMGFIDDIEKIIESLPENRQNLMFSATMAPKIRKLAHKLLKDPFEINLAVAKPAAGVTQRAFLAYDEQKLGLIDHLLTDVIYESILVFCSRKNKVTEVVRLLRKKGYDAQGISSDLEQKEREELLLKFRARQVNVLVATDVLSRGIDIQGIQLVINFDVPNHAEDYVHRIGRTARADTKGVAVTLINPDDMRKFHSIEQLIERELEKEVGPEALGAPPEWRADHRGGGHPGRGGRNKPKGKPRSEGGERTPKPPRPPKPEIVIPEGSPAQDVAKATEGQGRPKRKKPRPKPEGKPEKIVADAAPVEALRTEETPRPIKPRQKRRRKKPVAPSGENINQTSNSQQSDSKQEIRPPRRDNQQRDPMQDGRPQRLENQQRDPKQESRPQRRNDQQRPPRTHKASEGQSTSSDERNVRSQRGENRGHRPNSGRGKKRPSERQERMNAGNERQNIFDQKGTKKPVDKKPADAPAKGLGGFIKRLFGKK
jgi:ATP-dependent RNA helicase RhlE